MRRFLIIATFASLVIGCYSSIHIDKRPNLAVPIYKTSSNSNTNEITNWIIVDQGYEVTYRKRGFNIEIQEMRAEITTNKTVVFSLGGLHSTVCTNTITFKLEDIFKLANQFRECSNTNEVNQRSTIQ